MNPISEATTTPSLTNSHSIRTSSYKEQQQYSSLRQKWQTMELGLNDIKMALGTLKNACALLEMQTDRLGNEMTEMKGIIGPIILGPSTSEGSRSAQREIKSFSTATKSGLGLITPPGTPGRLTSTLHRINNSIGRIVHPEHISTAIYTTATTPPRQGILGKRHLTEDVDGPTPESTNQSPRRNKRVRFAEIDDIPTSHVRTPMHELSTTSESNNLILPIPKSEPRSSGTQSRSIGSRTEQTPFQPHGETRLNVVKDIVSPISPPTSPIILPSGKARKRTRSKFRDSMLFVRNSPHPRQKTRWDPTMGKRVPIITNTGRDTRSPTPSTTEGDYERRLSDDFSNASIG